MNPFTMFIIEEMRGFIMYIVGLKPIRIKDKMRYPGEPIPEAESWKPNVLRAHMQRGMVIMAADAVTLQKKLKDDWVKSQKVPLKANPPAPVIQKQAIQQVIRKKTPILKKRAKVLRKVVKKAMPKPVIEKPKVEAPINVEAKIIEPTKD